MDRLQFISSIVNSLAWPAVVAFLLYLVRSQLGPLVKRLTELTLPGGTKATFSTELKEAKELALTVAAEAGNERGNVASEPRSAIHEKVSNKVEIGKIYDDLTRRLKERIDILPLAKRKSIGEFILDNLREYDQDRRLIETYNSIRDTIFASYNATDDKISNLDVNDFGKVCVLFRISFEKAFTRWLEDHPEFYEANNQ